MAELHDIVFDSHHPASVARFWAAVLDGFELAPYDDAELERLRSVGIDDPEDDPTVLIQSSSGVRPRIFFQLVPEGNVMNQEPIRGRRQPAPLQGDLGGPRVRRSM